MIVLFGENLIACVEVRWENEIMINDKYKSPANIVLFRRYVNQSEKKERKKIRNSCVSLVLRYKMEKREKNSRINNDSQQLTKCKSATH